MKFSATILVSTLAGAACAVAVPVNEGKLQLLGLFLHAIVAYWNSFKIPRCGGAGAISRKTEDLRSETLQPMHKSMPYR